MFRYKAQVRSFQARLISAASLGEAFDIACGLPVSMAPAEPAADDSADEPTWYQFAVSYVEAK